ncbi:MAG: hypothetical protein ACO1QR_08135 [Chthoniobacteraceae bacterium]
MNDGTDPTLQANAAARFVYNGNVLEEGEAFLVNQGGFSQFFEMRYGLTSDDNDIRLLAVPEPGSAMAILGGLIVILGQRNRRAEGRD